MTTFPFALLGKGGSFNDALLNFKKWKGHLPSREHAHFEVSPDVHAEYRRLIVIRAGGADEFRRFRKKMKQAGEWPGLRYSGYQVREVEDLEPGTLNFVVENWREN